MLEYILKILSVIGLSAVKFTAGFVLAISYGFNQLEIMISAVGGGMIGVLIYLYLWDLFLKLRYRYFPRKAKPVKFSKFKRKLVVFYQAL